MSYHGVLKVVEAKIKSLLSIELVFLAAQQSFFCSRKPYVLEAASKMYSLVLWIVIISTAQTFALVDLKLPDYRTDDVLSLSLLINHLEYKVVEVYICDDKFETRDLLNEIITQSVDRVFKLKSSHQAVQSFEPEHTLLVVFVDYCAFKKSFSPEAFSSNGFFVIFLFEATIKEIESIFRVMWSNRIFKVRLVTRLDSEIRLLTFILFNPEKCHDTSLLIISNYTHGAWTPGEFSPETFSNLQNCKVKVNGLDNAPIVIKTILSYGTIEFDGIEVKLLRLTAKILNFTLQLESVDKDHGLIFESNKSASENIRHAITGDADAVLGSYYLTQVRAKHLSHTQVYRLDSTKVVGARDQPYSPLEKLLRPFNFWLFFSIFVILLFALVSPFLLQNLELRDLSLQYLNIVAVFLGKSQASLPKKSYLRLLFVSFSFFCINIQTIYQGSLFNLMQKDDVKKRNFHDERDD